MMTRRQGAFSAIRVVRGQHAFVTGATGFVGGHVARALSSEGWHVKALVRHGGNAHRLETRELAVEIVPSDLARRADIANAVAGCDAIVHVAGLVKARTLDDYRQERSLDRIPAPRRTAVGARGSVRPRVESGRGRTRTRGEPGARGGRRPADVILWRLQTRSRGGGRARVDRAVDRSAPGGCLWTRRSRPSPPLPGGGERLGAGAGWAFPNPGHPRRAGGARDCPCRRSF